MSYHEEIVYYRKYYKSVFVLGQIVENIGVSSRFSESCLNYFNRTLIASNIVFNLQSIKLSSAVKDEIYEDCLKKCLNSLYLDRNYATNSVRREFVYLYLKSVYLCKFLQMIDLNSFKLLLGHCSFFENANQCYFVQRTGPYFSDFIWNKTLEKQSANLIARKKQLKAINDRVERPLSYANEHCCKNRTKFGQNLPILRIKMLYGRGSKKCFSRSLDITADHLFIRIFGSLDQSLCKDLKATNICQLLDHILTRNKSCQFMNLLQKHCPSHERNKMNILGYSCKHENVINFVYSVLYYVFPMEIFGKRGNFERLYTRCKFMVTCGLKVKFRCSDLRGNQIDLNSCSWTKYLDCQHKKLIAFDLFLEFFADYILKLLRHHFYISESSSYKLIFFTTSDWAYITDNLVNDMVKKGDLVPVSNGEVNNKLKLCSLLRASDVRFIPRKSKMRMINRLKIEGKKFETQSALETLSYLLTKITNTSPTERHMQNICNLQHMMRLGKSKKLYFIRADIQDCYPTIDQFQLYDLIISKFKISGILSKESLKVREIDVVSDGTKVKKQFVLDKEVNFSSLFHSKLSNNCNIIVPKRISSLTYQTVELLFRNYIIKPYVRVGPKRWYQLHKGIRQGGSLSSALCALFIQHTINKVLQDFGSLNEETRLILEDDMVFITASEERARKALVDLVKILPEYGLHINISKLNFNFKNPFESRGFRENFSFLGRIIKLEQQSILVDYSKYYNEELQYSFNCDLFIPIKRASKNIIDQLHLSVVSWDLNCKVSNELTVALNVYERSILQVSRLASYLLLSPHYKISQNVHSIIIFMRFLAKKFWSLVVKWSKDDSFNCSLSRKDFEWIVNYASKKVWNRRCLLHRKLERNAINREFLGQKNFICKQKTVWCKKIALLHPIKDKFILKLTEI